MAPTISPIVEPEMPLPGLVVVVGDVVDVVDVLDVVEVLDVVDVLDVVVELDVVEVLVEVVVDEVVAWAESARKTINSRRTRAHGLRVIA
jgi:hypothetical protein